jgi:TatD DNase family protein
LIDTHCHLHDRKFDSDRDDVVTRAREAGITRMLTIGEDLSDSRRAIAIAKQYGVYAAAGIHPHNAKDAPEDLESELHALLKERCVVAVGEMGLDYYYDNSPREAQRRVLRAQLRVAREAALPVVFHLRDAFDDFTAILRDEWKPPMRGVLHCFTGTPNEARTCVNEFGLLLGIGGVLTFPNAGNVRDAVRAVGIEHVVLETDCPYLAPVPMRGRRNEPSFIVHTAAKISESLGIGIADIVAATDRNAIRLFGL